MPMTTPRIAAAGAALIALSMSTAAWSDRDDDDDNDRGRHHEGKALSGRGDLAPVGNDRSGVGRFQD